MKTAVTLLAIVMSVALYSHSQQSSQPPGSRPPAKPATASKTAAESESAKIADIRKLLELTGTREMVDQMKAMQMDQFRQASPDLPGDMFQEMLNEMRAEDLENALIPIYLKYFTTDDLKRLLAFYESPFGKKVTRVMPQILQESNQVGMSWGQNVVLKVAAKWRKEGKLTEREYQQLIGEEDHPH